MTPLQEQALRAMLKRHRAQQREASTKLARHIISKKAVEEINTRQENEIITLVRGIITSSYQA